MNPNIPSYPPPTHAGESRPTLQVNTNALQAPFAVPAYPAGTSQPGFPSASHPNDHNVYDPNSPSSVSPTPASSTSLAQPGDASPKRKRSRVTPEQLARLEELFASDRSPTVSRRKEISAELGMRERQTQIWFQNRRAKAKVQEGKGKPRTKKSAAKNRKSGMISPGMSTQDLSGEEEEDEGDDYFGRPPPLGHPHYERYVANRFQEPSPISVIPCHVLKIGTWPTISDSSKGRELVAFVAERQGGAALVMVWFFSEGGKSYKLELPVAAIESTHVMFEPMRSGDPYPIATARLGLSRLPAFYVLQKSVAGRSDAASSSSQPVNTPRTSWTPCPDFTQGGTGASARIYEMQGPAQPMVQVLRNFPHYSQDGGLSPSAMRPPQLHGSGMQAGMAVPMLPNIPQGDMGAYPSYHQPLPPQHAAYAARSVSGPTPAMYSPQYVQQPAAVQRQLSFPQPVTTPTFAFDVNSTLASQGYPGPVSDPEAPPAASNYAHAATRPFTAETLTTPYFPDLSSPVFREAAQSLMNDEQNAHMYSSYTQQAQYSPSHSAPHPDPQVASTSSYHAQSAYGPPYPHAQGAPSGSLPQEYPMQYGGQRSVSQPLHPPGSVHGYPSNPGQ